MSAYSRLLLVIACSTGLIFPARAQFDKTEKAYRSYAYAGLGVGLWSFRGDETRGSLMTGKPSLNMTAGYSYENFRAEANYLNGIVLCDRQGAPDPQNFRTLFHGTELRLLWQPRIPSEASRFSPVLGAGLAHSWFSSYTDAKDAQGHDYYYWNDGTIRNKPPFPNYESTSQVLQRDYTYESPLAIRQTSLYFPLTIGFQLHVNRNMLFSAQWDAILLQSDNMDRNTSTQAWDRLQRVSVGLTWRFIKRPLNPQQSMAVTAPLPSSPVPDYSSVDFEALLHGDEDGDGVKDLYDECYGTPPGTAIDNRGCPVDTDRDGIPDYLDSDNNTAPGSWVDDKGIALTDEQLQARYNDSLSHFFVALRLYDKNVRPFPVKKYIPQENYERYNRLLEQHPEWRMLSATGTLLIPSELQPLDLNKDQFLSIEELEKALHRMFDGKDPRMTPELFQQALYYAFEVQQ